jgi:anti-sigma-K factor RskA
MSDTHLSEWPASPDELLAAEYALGVLDGDELRSAETRIESDPAFAQLAAAWQERLAPLAEAVEEMPARADVWSRIEQRLGGAVPGRAAKPASWWESLAVWRMLTAGAVGLAAASLALLLLFTAPQPPGEPMIASIAGASGTPIFVAMIDESGMLSVMPMAQSDDPAHAHELWIIGPGEEPISIGLVPATGLRRMKMPPAHMERAHNGALLAVSQEPPGGSPNGKPTTVLGAGPIQRL